MKITVSELIVKYLEGLGIEYIFGMPGAHILPVYDSLYGSRVRTVLAKHEQGAAFMAGGYARVSGKVAACIMVVIDHRPFSQPGQVGHGLALVSIQ